MAALVPSASWAFPLDEDTVLASYRVTTNATPGTADEYIVTPYGPIVSVVGVVSEGSAPAAPVAATGTITFDGVNVAGKIVTIDGVIYTSNADPAATDYSEAYLYDVGANLTEAATKLRDAINAGNGFGANSQVTPGITTFGLGTNPHPTVTAVSAAGVVTLTAIASGTLGNAITISTDETNGLASGATLAGGADGGAAVVVQGNAQGTAVSAGVNPGDIGIEAGGVSATVTVTVIQKRTR